MGLLEAGVSSVVSSGMGDAFKTISGDIISGISSIAPYALGVMAVFLGWKYGARFFKSVGK